MTSPAVTPLVYADLAETRRLLGVGLEPARDAVLARIAEGVTDLIGADLGVRWDETDSGIVTRTVTADGSGTAVFPIPCLLMTGVALLGEPLTAGEAIPAFASPDRGWHRGLVIRSYAALGQSLDVTGVWADRPGTAPPAAVIQFASWATAQLWRRQSAGHSGEIGPDGYRAVTDDPWKSQDWKIIRGAYRVPRTGAV